MKKILVLLLVCALVFSLMSMTACRQQTDNNSDNNNQGDNNQGDNNQGDNQGDNNNQGGDNQGGDDVDNTIVPGDDTVNDKGSIETPPIPADSTDNRGK